MASTSIEWTNGGMVWNPTTGCNKISQGCKNCYAEKKLEQQLKEKTEQFMIVKPQSRSKRNRLYLEMMDLTREINKRRTYAPACKLEEPA